MTWKMLTHALNMAKNQSRNKRKQKKMTIEDGLHVDREISSLTHESFTVKEEQREVYHTKKVRVNKQNEVPKKKGILERNIEVQLTFEL